MHYLFHPMRVFIELWTHTPQLFEALVQRVFFLFAVIIHKAGGMSIMISYSCLHGMSDDFRHLLKGPFGLVGKPLCLSQPLHRLRLCSTDFALQRSVKGIVS